METTYSYLHRVQYYETDGMRIVHHANYIHWMEEARIAYMEEAGYGYDRMEADGIAIPVLGNLPRSCARDQADAGAHVALV